MSLKRKLISGVISAFAVVSFTTFASAQDTDKSQQDSTQRQQRQEKRQRRDGMGKRNGEFRGMRGGRGGGMMRGFRELNLTDAQKEQIRTILEANKPDKSQFESLRPLMEAKRNGTLTDAQKQQLQDLKAQRKQNAENVRAQVLNVLTADQRAQLEKSQEEWKQKREERKQMRKERRNQKNTDDN